MTHAWEKTWADGITKGYHCLDCGKGLLIPGEWLQPAIAIEARRAATLGAVHESAGPQDIAQPQSGPSHD